jgi:hypothetical protein
MELTSQFFNYVMNKTAALVIKLVESVGLHSALWMDSFYYCLEFVHFLKSLETYLYCVGTLYIIITCNQPFLSHSHP